jgi:hypothetical protein
MAFSRYPAMPYRYRRIILFIQIYSLYSRIAAKWEIHEVQADLLRSWEISPWGINGLLDMVVYCPDIRDP